MSNTDTIDRIALRRTIRQTIREADDPPTYSDLVGIVATGRGVPEEVVSSELDACEREGFVYCVGDDDPVVKLP